MSTSGPRLLTSMPLTSTEKSLPAVWQATTAGTPLYRPPIATLIGPSPGQFEHCACAKPPAIPKASAAKIPRIDIFYLRRLRAKRMLNAPTPTAHGEGEGTTDATRSPKL